MKKSFYLAFLLIFSITSSFALANESELSASKGSNLSIESVNEAAGGLITLEPFTGTYCYGSTIVLNFSAGGQAFGFFNIFTAQLSDADGDFSNPINIGSVSLIGVVGSSFLTATIPNTVPLGNGYRIRIISSDPEIIGGDNGAPLIIKEGVPTVPTVQVNGPTTFCFGSASTFLLSDIPNGNLWFPGGTNTAPFLGVVGEGCYYTTVTSNNGCQASSNVTCISVNTPIFTFLGYFEDNQLVSTSDTTVTICEGDSAQLGILIEGGVGPFNLIYTGDNINFVEANQVGEFFSPGVSVHRFFVDEAGTYQFVGLQDNFANCGANTSGGLVTVNLTPPPVTSFSYEPFCGSLSGEPIKVAGFLEGGIFSFTTEPGDGATVDAATGVISGAVGGSTYDVTYTVEGDFCQGISSASVTVELSDIVEFSYAPFCFGNSSGLPITVEGFADGGVFSFVTEPIDGATIDAATGVLSNGASAANYDVSYQSPAGECQNSFTFTVTVNPLPSIEAVIQETECGQELGSISLTITLGTEPYIYTWSNTSDNVSSIQNLAEGDYSVNVVDQFGCQVDSVFAIENSNEPELEFVVIPATCGDANGGVELTVVGGSGDYSFLWTPGDVTTQNIANQSAGTLTVEVIDNITTCVVSGSASINNQDAPVLIPTVINTLCGQSSGSISIQIQDGTGVSPFVFEWNDSSTDTFIENLGVGSYSITVTDANDCEVTFSSEIINENQFLASFVAENPTCLEPNGGSIDISITNGTSPFTYAWSPNIENTQQDAVNLESGVYTIAITDDADCEAILEVSLAPVNTIELDFTKEDATCGNSDGSINLIISGVSTNNSILWNDGSLTEDRDLLASGSYSVTVTNNDDESCTASLSIEIENSNQPTVETTVTNTPCSSVIGSVTLTINNGSGDYIIEWSGPNGFTATNVEAISNLEPGVYNFTVVDNVSNCEVAGSGEVLFENLPILTANVVNTRCAQNNGIIDVTIAEGTEPFSISWSDGSTTEDIINLAPGDYTITVTDGSSCEVVETYTVAPSIQPTVDIVSINPACSQDTGSIDITLINALIPALVSWTLDGEPFANTQDLNNLGAGQYALNVVDGNGCIITDVVTLVNTDQPIVTAIVENTDCGETTGSISIVVESGSGSYETSWTGPNDFTSDLESITNLAFGCYTLVLNDANGCSATITECIANENGPEVEFTAVQPSCNLNNGQLSITISGGLPEYEVIWDGPFTGEALVDLAEGTYSVEVIDANGCEGSGSFTLINTGVPSVAETIVQPTCGNSDGSISLLASGGVEPYTYVWTPEVSVDANAVDLATGIYTVVVSDATNCEVTVTYELSNADIPQLSFTSVNPSCGSENGSIDLIVNPSSVQYNYTWLGPNGFTADTQDLSDLEEGEYIVTVSDLNGDCSNTLSVTLTSTLSFEVSAEVIDATCGLSNGQINLVITGEEAPFSILWCDGSSDVSAFNLPAGSCTVTVTDANGCEFTDTYSVGDSQGPVISLNTTNASCEQCDGSIELVIVGGTAPYSILWSNGSSDVNSISGLCEGPYSVTVTDANLCQVSLFATIEGGIGPVVTAQTGSASCGSNNGFVNLEVSGGVPPFTFSWVGPDGFVSISQNLTQLFSGTYTVTVSDQSACSSELTVNISDEDLPILVFDVTPSNCGQSIGAVDLVVVNAASDATFSWTGPNGFVSSQQNISGLAGGTYNLTLTSGLCIVESTVIVPNADAPVANISIDNSAVCLGESALVTITIEGVGPFNLAYSNGVNTVTLNDFADNTFTLNVSPTETTTYSIVSIATTANPTCFGVPIFDSVILNVNPIPSTPSVSVEGDLSFCIGGSVVLISSVVDGNVWNIDGPNQFNQAITVTESGFYFTTITNEFDCSASSASIEVDVIDGITIEAGDDVTICLGDVVQLQATGATSYVWSPSIGLTGTIISNPLASPPFTQTYVVTGNSDCGSGVDSVTVTVLPLLDATLPQDFQICPGDIPTVSVVNPVEGGLYVWGPESAILGSNTGSSVQVSITEQTNIFVTTTNSNGCVSSDTVTISIGVQPPAPVIIAEGPTEFCEGESVVLTSTTGNFVVWSNGLENLNQILVTESGTYSVTLVSGDCPSTSNEIEVVVFPAPVVNITPSGTQSVCEGSCVTLTSNTADGFVWSTPDGSPITQAIEACVSGDYILTVTDENCTKSDTVTVIVIPAPETPTITVDGGTFSICENESVDLISSSETGNQWFQNGQLILGATFQVLNVSSAGIYTVRVTEGACSSVSEPVAILIKPVSPLEITSDQPLVVCEGSPSNIVLTASIGFVTYEWTPEGSTQSITVSSAGQYTVVGVNQDGCSTSASVEIVVSPPITLNVSSPVFYDDINVSVKGGQDGSIDLVAEGGTEPLTYAWSNGASTQNLSNLAAGEYTVTVTDDAGCTSVISITLKEAGDIALPNGFTPNGDGFNDFYVIKGIQSFTGNSVNIFNRWGNLVYSATNYTNNWDGISNSGNLVPDGTYFIVVDLNKDNQKLEGFIDLRRSN